MPSWRRVFTSDEARIESKAGASLPTSGYTCLGCGAWDTSPRTDGRCSNGSPTGSGCGWVPVNPWPQPQPPPFAADDEGRAESC